MLQETKEEAALVEEVAIKDNTTLPSVLHTDIDCKIGIEVEASLRPSAIIPGTIPSGYREPQRGYIGEVKLWESDALPEKRAYCEAVYHNHELYARTDFDVLIKEKLTKRFCKENKLEGILNNVGFDGGGIELRFNPFNYDQWIKPEVQAEIEAIFDELLRAKYTVENSPTAGVHLHFDRQYFTKGIYAKMVKWINNCKYFMAQFSGRFQYNGNYSCWVQNVYLDSEADFRIDQNSYEGIRFNLVNTGDGYGHAETKYTLEFRLFGTTLYLPKLMSYMEFIFALKAFADSPDFEVSVPKFAEFVKTKTPQFIHLNDVLSNYGYIKNESLPIPVLESPAVSV